MNTLLANLARFLQSLLKLSPSEESETPDESPILLPPSVRMRLSAKPSKPDKRPLRQRLKSGLFHFLEKCWVFVVLVFVGVLLVWRSEVGNHEWLTDKVEQYGESWLPRLLETLQRYPFTARAIPVAVAFLVLIAMRHMLRRGLGGLWRWSAAHKALAIAIAAAGITLGIYFSVNVNTWTFGVVEVGIDDLEADDIAIQFRGSLNAIGTPPLDRLALSSLGAPKKVKEARASLEHLSLTDCPEILLGPDTPEYEGQPISLKRPQSGGLPDSGGQTITFNTAMGSVDLPLESFFRSVLRFSPGYREFSIQVIPAGQADELDLGGNDENETPPFSAEVIRIIVNDNKGRSWTVAGPRQDLPQLVDFLVIRMILDVKVKPAEILNDRLALTLGNQAFDSRDFDSALAYYHLAESFNRKDPIIQTALGVTHYQLCTLAADNEKELSLRRARHALQRAQFQSTSPSTSLPYLACIQNELDDYKEEAPDTLKQFNATLKPVSPEAVSERRDQLGPGKNPSLGPGREISLFIHQPEAEGEQTFDIYYFTESTLYFGKSLTGTQSVTNTQILSDTLSAPPRQIFAVRDGVYYLTRDGLVNFYQPRQPDKRIIKDTDLQFEFTLPNSTDNLIYTGGIRQIFVAQPPYPYLFAVGRFGQILRYDIGEPVDTTQDKISPESFVQADEADARQIFLDGDTLYLLKNEGSIWRIPNVLATNALKPERQLIADADIQEIAVNGGYIYMLRRDGTIWLYRDRGDTEENRSIRLDRGANTIRIFAAPQGLFSLKNTGEVFFIPAPKGKEALPIHPLELPEADRNAIAAIGKTLLALEKNTSTGLLDINAYDGSQKAPMLAEQVEVDPTATADAIATAAAAAATQTIQTATAEASAVAGAIQANAETATAEAIAAQTAETLLAPTATSPALLPTFSATEAQTPTPAAYTPPATEAPPADGPTPTATATLSSTLSPTPAAPPTPPPSHRIRSIDEADEVPVRRNEDVSRRFWIDSTEVTNRQYRLCVEDGACPENKQYSGLFTRDKHPVVGVNYHQAKAYCEWVGGALPTARQWREVATPGGAPYPWGDDPKSPECRVAVINDNCDDEELGTRPVGSKPDGARTFEDSEAKVYDLIGNVWEWTQDPGTGKDDIRIVLGGSWSNPDGTVLGGMTAFEPFNEISQGEEHQERNLGFRCVRPFEVEESIATQQP